MKKNNKEAQNKQMCLRINIQGKCQTKIKF